MDANSMERLRSRQMEFGEEPICFAAYDDDDTSAEEVLCHGSDKTLSQSARVAQRLRYEHQALRFLKGQRPMLLSTVLRGPFDQASGWRNPWLRENQQSSNIQPTSTQQCSKVAVKSGALARIDVEMTNTTVDQTPPTRNSIRCQLPSPDSHRELELELLDDANPENVAQLLIQNWRSKVPLHNLERDEFWAPDGGIGATSDGPDTPKRPAGKEWLKSKLNKRRRRDHMSSSFATTCTPTPNPEVSPRAKASPADVSVRTQREPQVKATASQSFERNTPASSVDQNQAYPPQEPDLSKASPGNFSTAGDEPRRYNVAVKASVLRKPGSSSRVHQASRTLSETAASECSDEPVINGLSGVAVPASVIRSIEHNQPSDCSVSSLPDTSVLSTHKIKGTQDNVQRDLPSESDNINFESHLDQSFQYKARVANQEAMEFGEIDTQTRSSQATRTGAPETDVHDDSGETQARLTDVDNADHLEATGHIQIEADSPSLHAKTRQHVLSLSQKESVSTLEMRAAGNDDVEKDPPGLKKSIALEGTTCLPEDQILVNTEDAFNLLQQATNSDHYQTYGSGRSEISLPMTKPYGYFAETLLDEGSTLDADPMNTDASTPSQLRKEPVIAAPIEPLSQASETLEAARIGLQSVSHPQLAETQLETVQHEAVRLNNNLSPRPEVVREVVQEVPHPGLSSPQETSRSNQRLHSSAGSSGNTRDKTAESGGLTLEVSLLQNEQAFLETANKERSSVQNTSNEGDLPTRLQSSVERVEIGQIVTVTEQQSPWGPADPKIKVELIEDKEWLPCSHPISIASSPGATISQLRLFHVHQDILSSMDHDAASRASGMLQSSLHAEQSQHSTAVPEDQQSSWGSTINRISRALPVHMSSPSQVGLPRLMLDDTVVVSMESRSLSADSDNVTSTVKALGAITRSVLSESPVTPSQSGGRQQSVEPNLSIKSFATFNTPSPKRRRTPRRSLPSAGCFPSTQMLTDVTNTNPWSSLRSSLRSSTRPRSHLRVSFGPLPAEDRDSENNLIESHTRIAASPPPPSKAETSAEDEGDSNSFYSHFDAMRHRDDRSGSPPKSCGAPRLLPSESQQVPMTPGIDMMAQAFKDADVANPLRVSPYHDVAISEQPFKAGSNDDVTGQSPWRVDSQRQSADDVATVLQNLDDFLNPKWDVEAELDKAKTAEGIENQRQGQSPAVLEGNIWDLA